MSIFNILHLQISNTCSANVLFFYNPPSPPGTKVDVVLSYTPDGPQHWRAIAIHSGRVRRTEVLSACGRTEAEALEALHVKSAQAVGNYYSSHGASYPPAHGLECESDVDEEDEYMLDDEQELVTTPDWDDDSDTSDDEAVVVELQGRDHDARGPHSSGMTSANTHNPRRGLCQTARGAGSRMDQNPAPASKRNPTAVRASPRIGQHADAPSKAHQPKSSRDVPPPEPQIGGLKVKTHSWGVGELEPQADADDRLRLATHPATTRPRQTNASQPRVEAQAVARYPVRLTISTSTSHFLAHHSPVYQLVTVLPAPSLRALLGAAVTYIRTMPIPGITENRPVPTLRARVKRVKMDDVMWDMAGFRADDLSIFFACTSKTGSQATPVFELEVEDATGAKAATEASAG